MKAQDLLIQKYLRGGKTTQSRNDLSVSSTMTDEDRLSVLHKI